MKNFANPPKVLKRSPSDEAHGEPATHFELAAAMNLEADGEPVLVGARAVAADSAPVGAHALAGGSVQAEFASRPLSLQSALASAPAPPRSSGSSGPIRAVSFAGGVRLCAPTSWTGVAPEEIESQTDIDSQTLEASASVSGGAEPHDGEEGWATFR